MQTVKVFLMTDLVSSTSRISEIVKNYGRVSPIRKENTLRFYPAKSLYHDKAGELLYITLRSINPSKTMISVIYDNTNPAIIPQTFTDACLQKIFNECAARVKKLLA